jgi:hypothetical protein
LTKLSVAWFKAREAVAGWTPAMTATSRSVALCTDPHSPPRLQSDASSRQ